jgi:hypothetical protein
MLILDTANEAKFAKRVEARGQHLVLKRLETDQALPVSPLFARIIGTTPGGGVGGIGGAAVAAAAAAATVVK